MTKILKKKPGSHTLEWRRKESSQQVARVVGGHYILQESGILSHSRQCVLLPKYSHVVLKVFLDLEEL